MKYSIEELRKMPLDKLKLIEDITTAEEERILQEIIDDKVYEMPMNEFVPRSNIDILTGEEEARIQAEIDAKEKIIREARILKKQTTEEIENNEDMSDREAELIAEIKNIDNQLPEKKKKGAK